MADGEEAVAKPATTALARSNQGGAAANSPNGVSRVRHIDINDLLSPRTERRQSLNGYQECYSDIVHYIAYCTHRIWAEKGIGLIYDHYDPACLVHTPYGTSAGVDDVVASTLQMMQAFPDRSSRLVNVAWCGDDRQGFYTSHLGQSRMTNLGPSAYGPATGRKVSIRHIADCESVANRITREWLVRDNGALVRQIGLDPHEVAKKMAAAELARGADPVRHGLTERDPGQRLPVSRYLPAANVSAEERLRVMFHEIWNARRLDRLKEFYAPNAYVHTAPGRDIQGLNGITWQIIRLLAAMPNAAISFDHFCDVQETDGYIAAVRWTLNGTHTGNGMFGGPSGNPVSILGMSHFRFEGDLIVQEWTVWDEISVLMQVHAPVNALGV
ncbi:ester cyclase [Niveispirillum sp.]|uniref:ester cyclase n=1 Tax=Niveispirillum sp. TaxID=1917217 RepID=UPI001B5DA004|nr:ester cyclase [Niveispirillum sp.]MBP7339385.1 ester cyclase [Niveispirillum sp.]